MRIGLNLTYVMMRTCDSRDDGRRTWVGWCPELAVTTEDVGLAQAIWTLRSTVRGVIHMCVARNIHPARNRDLTKPDDPAWALYRDYQKRDDQPFRTWSHTYRAREVPTSVETCFVETQALIETGEGRCMISEDGGYGQCITYRTGRLVRMRLLVETEYETELDLLEDGITLDAVRRLYGGAVREIISAEER